jgi:phenylacetate-coenzyme A ligase PaaK-like adenylate-forming protein
MWPLCDPWQRSAMALDVLMSPRSSPAALGERRQRRLAALLEAAQASPLYRQRFERHGASFAAQPPVTKKELMARFGEWVTDRRLTLPALRAFISDPSLIGEAFLGEYAVWESTGSTGEPGIFVQDSRAMAVYDSLEALRRPAATAWQRWLDPFYMTERVAFVGATGGHFASTVSLERLRRMMPGMAACLRGFSLLQSRRDLLDALQRWQPTTLATYPTAALMLAEEAAAGRLRLALRQVLTGGENLSDAMRGTVARRFGCPVHGSYGASEFLALASECDHRRLHLNNDWAILEPVDEQGRNLPDGETGYSTLLTNLANHVQPLIRYDLGDRVRIETEPCACGSSLPVIEVQGRVDDALVLSGPRGRRVRLPPLAVTTVLEEGAGVFEFQLVQQGPRALSLTIASGGGAEVLTRARHALTAYLRDQGLGTLTLEVRHGPPARCGRSGKLPRIVKQLGRAAV